MVSDPDTEPIVHKLLTQFRLYFVNGYVATRITRYEFTNVPLVITQRIAPLNLLHSSRVVDCR